MFWLETIDWAQVIIGSLLGGLVAFAAWRARSLSNSGAIAAGVMGALLFGIGGLGWAAVLLAFFISSSAFSRMFKRQKRGLNEKFSKGSQRDWAQVLANGGVGTLMLAFYLAYPEATWPWAAFAGAMAAVNADTWATELGVLSKNPPRLLTTMQIVERGTSGGVSLAGSLAAAAGAAFIALFALAGFSPRERVTGFIVITAAGLLGSLLDSFLGASIQAIYTCPTCQKETEQHPTHSCGTRTWPLRGWSWFNNDVVNTGASLSGALIAGLVFLLWL